MIDHRATIPPGQPRGNAGDRDGKARIGCRSSLGRMNAERASSAPTASDKNSAFGFLGVGIVLPVAEIYEGVERVPT